MHVISSKAFVRRWLAKMVFNKLKREKELSALTIQKNVRGWLTRRRFQLMREKKIREKIEMERRERKNENVAIQQSFISRSALLQRLNSQEEKGDKENRAAVVIQTCELKHI